jgi:PTH1 family peptidyl-tRNA hydrolase
MNASGSCVRRAMGALGLAADDLLLVHDDLDLEVGRLRLKRGGGDGGHNGVRSVTEHLGTVEFARLRVGIGRPAPDFSGPSSTPCSSVRRAR